MTRPAQFPPSSNTGGKISTPNPVNQHAAHVDAFAFSFVQEGFTHADLDALACALSPFFRSFSAIPRRFGWMGFSHSADVNIGGLVAYGGDHQRDRIYVSLMGQACSLVTDWPGLAAFLEEIGARISRVDLAHDDLEGQNYSVDTAIDDYKKKLFSAGGNQPSHKFISSGAFGETPARTIYIGKRENGKMLRVYEKGLEQRDTEHPKWVRVELELRAKDRVIPFDVLLNPAAYLAASYPALYWISQLYKYVKTFRIVVQKTLDQMAEWAQRQVGRVVHALTVHHGGDIGQVFTRLNRAQLPRRLQGAYDLLKPDIQPA